MALQTYDGLKVMVGEERLAKFGPSLPGGSSPSAFWAAKLSAATATIHSVLRQGGYAVPVDFTRISDTTLRAETEALLAEWCGTLALELAAPAMVATPKGVDSQADLVRRELQKVTRGTIRLAIPLTGKIFTSVYGPDADGSREVAPSLPDSLFYRSRTGFNRGG